MKEVTIIGAYDTCGFVAKDENRGEHVGQITAHKGIRSQALSRKL